MSEALRKLRWNRYMLFLEIVGREWHGTRLTPADAWRIACGVHEPWKR